MSTFDGDALKASRYFKRFKKLVDCKLDLGPFQRKVEPMSLLGDMILVEKLPKVEKSVRVGGKDLIIAEAKTHRDTFADEAAEFGIVLMVGPGQHLEDGTVIEPVTKPGDVVLLTGRVDWYSQFGHMQNYEPNTIGRVRDSDLFMFFKDYAKAMEILNAKAD